MVGGFAVVVGGGVLGVVELPPPGFEVTVGGFGDVVLVLMGVPVGLFVDALQPSEMRFTILHCLSAGQR
jgi:hypothetical protein